MGYLSPNNQMHSHLVISYVEQGTYTDRVIRPGMIVKSVNGFKLNTLDEFKKHFIPSQDLSGQGPCALPWPKSGLYATWSLTMNSGESLVVDFKEELENAKLQHAPYKLTPTVR